MLKQLSFLILATLISFSLAAQQKVNKSFSGVKQIKLSTGSGDCSVVKSSTNEVTVDLTYTYSEENYIPVLEQEGNTLLLSDKFKNNRSGSGYSKWRLAVPDNIELKFNAGSGDLEITQVNISISSNTGSGDIEMANVNGSFSSNSGSGEVSIDGYQGDLKINAGSGDVEMTDAKGELKINLGSGDITAENIEGGVKFNAGSGDVMVKDAIITSASGINSGSGDASLVLRADLKANISINSGSGDATLDFNGLEIQGAFTMKANKKNGEISAPFEFDEVTEEEQGNQTIITKKAKIGSSNIAIQLATGSGRAAVKK